MSEAGPGLVEEFRKRLLDDRAQLARTVAVTGEELASLEMQPGDPFEDVPVQDVADTLSRLEGRERRPARRGERRAVPARGRDLRRVRAVLASHPARPSARDTHGALLRRVPGHRGAPPRPELCLRGAHAPHAKAEEDWGPAKTTRATARSAKAGSPPAEVKGSPRCAGARRAPTPSSPRARRCSRPTTGPAPRGPPAPPSARSASHVDARLEWRDRPLSGPRRQVLDPRFLTYRLRQRRRRAHRHGLPLGGGAGLVRRRPLPALERHPQQPDHALGGGDRRGQRLPRAVAQHQRQHARPPGPPGHLRARCAPGDPDRARRHASPC